MRYPRDFKHGHRTVQKAVHDLKASRLVAPHRRGVPCVACLALARRVLEHNIGRLEDAERQRVRTILTNCLEQAR
jgi:hypothetical protein